MAVVNKKRLKNLTFLNKTKLLTENQLRKYIIIVDTKTEGCFIMKLILVILSYKKETIITDDKKRSKLHRPDYLLLSEFDSATSRFGRIKLIITRNEKLPPYLVKKMVDRNTLVTTWDNDEMTLLKKLIGEAGTDPATVNTDTLKDYLNKNVFPCATLYQASQKFDIKSCPRDDARTLPKVKCRIKVTKKIITKLLRRNKLHLFDSITL